MITTPIPRNVAASASLALAVLGSLSSCTTTPGSSRTEASKTSTAVDVRTLAKVEESGILPLASGTDAFGARLALARKAQRTLDLQYYIWHGDETGKLLAGAAVEAAERGVKVRILIDDIGTAADDRRMVILDSHPNVEVRLFNPVSLRSARMLGALLEFKRVNRRMHNKAFIVDDRVAIIGGRNIGDEYFGAADDMNFADFDVVARGPVVAGVVDAFGLYWSSGASVPITKVSHEQVTAADLQQGMQELLAHRDALKTTPYAQTIRSGRLAAARLDDIPFLKGQAMVVTDNPEKVATRPTDNATHLAPQLRGIVAATQKELLLVSPYTIPRREGVKWFADLEKRGVRVRLVTNSLGSNDVVAVHAGYAKYRKPLLDHGVEIYELKAAPGSPGKGRSGSGFPSLSLSSSSKAGLHAKTFVFDRRWVFVGSLNLDPRSLDLNTEIGMIIDCPALAEQMLTRIDSALPDTTYQLGRTSTGLLWISRENGQTVTATSEPGSTFATRFKSRLVSLLPIEGQL